MAFEFYATKTWEMSCKNDIDGALLGTLSQHGDLCGLRSSSRATSQRGW